VIDEFIIHAASNLSLEQCTLGFALTHCLSIPPLSFRFLDTNLPWTGAN